MKAELFITVVIFIIPNLLLVGWLLKEIFQKANDCWNPVGEVHYTEVKREVITLRKNVEVSEYMLEELKRSGIDHLEYVKQITARDFSEEIMKSNLMYSVEQPIPLHMMNSGNKCYEIRLDVVSPKEE